MSNHHAPSERVKQRVAENLRRLRESLGLTVDEFAERAGISRQSLYLLEAARTFPRPETLDKIAKAFSVNSDELYMPEEVAPLLPRPLAEAIDDLPENEKPTEQEIREMLAVRFRGRPTAQTYKYLLQAFRSEKKR